MHVERFGFEPEEFWNNTRKHTLQKIQYYKHKTSFDMSLFRNVEFAVFKTAFRGMEGKQAYKNIKKPSDIRKLPTDPKPKVLTDDQADTLLKQIAKPNTNGRPKSEVPSGP